MFALNQNPNVIRYTGDDPFESEEAAKRFLENYSEYKNTGFGRWAVVLKDTDEFIGWCGLKLHEGQYVDIGFRFFETHWNKGYASEAARASLDYAFQELDLTEVVGRVAKDNLASIRILEKLGMTFWKKDTCNGIENALYYKVSRSEYNSDVK